MNLTDRAEPAEPHFGRPGEMTSYPSLADRAERALLGALLLDPRRFEQLSGLTPGDFNPGVHRDVFAVLKQSKTFLLAADTIDPDQRSGLKQSCPDPDHITVYAQMVIEAGLRRSLFAHALRLENAAGDLHYQARRLEQVASPGSTAEDMLERSLRTRAGHAEQSVKRLLSHELLVSLALRAHVNAFDPDRDSPSPSEPAAPDPADGLAVISPSVAAWHAAIESSAAPRHEATAREERVLAGIIQRHLQSSDLPGWPPPEVFTSAACQEVFTAIVSLHNRGEPIDELTTDWERARHQAANPESPALDSSYAQRLARVPVRPTEALIAYRALLAEHGMSAAILQVRARSGPVSCAPAASAPLLDPVHGRRPSVQQPPGPPSTTGPQPRMA